MKQTTQAMPKIIGPGPVAQEEDEDKEEAEGFADGE
jgi:hypothetical protein